uniref:Surface antigen n=2 Tax=Candidatus Bipolaricaulota TaxID=67810 RepID=H5SMP2_9BACT|nr:surface antigen [uncultured Acetothermia bacterium]BAL59810.1 surface antigen [Candidatus Acetothermum autotrophicum]
MLSRVAKCLVIVGGVALFAMLAGAVPQPSSAPQAILEQLPQLDAIQGLADTEALVFNAAGTKGYIVHVGRDDNAFVTELTVPNTKGGQCELGVLKGPRGSHAVGYDEAGARLWVGNFPEGNVSVVDVSQPLKEKCVVTGTVAVNDSATDVVYDAGRKQAYVSGLMTHSVYVLARKEGEKEEYELKATVDLSEACRGPNALALGGNALYAACMFSNNVVQVNLGTLKLDGAVGAGAEPVDIKLAADGKLYVAAAVSNAVVVLDSLQMLMLTSIAIEGLQTTEPHPRYVALSPEERLVYTSNAPDQSVSAICRSTNQVVETFRAISETRITMPGVLAAVDHEGKHLLYVVDKGGLLKVFVVDSIYEKCQ